MNVQQYRERLKEAKQKIIDALPEIGNEIAVSTLSLIKDRSINEGIDIDGKPGNKKKYSTKQVPTFLFKGKELNRSGTAYIAANELGNWDGFKKAQGRGSENVNLAYSMRMWTSIQVIKANPVGTGKFQLVVGGADEETRKKMEWNTERFGSFIDPLPEEIQMNQQIAKEKLEEFIKNI